MIDTTPPAAAAPSTLVDGTGIESSVADLGALTKLRTTLRLNAAFSLSSGLVGIIFAGWVAGRLGIGDNGALWVRLLSGCLVGFSLVLFGLAGASARRLLPMSLEVVVADLIWVAATGVLIALGAFSTGGAVHAVVLGAIVLDFAIAQFAYRARAIRATAKANTATP